MGCGRTVRRIAGWVVDPVGSVLDAAGVPVPFPHPSSLVNPPKRPSVSQPIPPPPADAPPPPAGPQVVINQRPARPAPTPAAPGGPDLAPAPRLPRTGIGDVGDRTKGLINPGGDRTLLR